MPDPVDAKLISPKPEFKLSGTQLFGLLVAVLFLGIAIVETFISHAVPSRLWQTLLWSAIASGLLGYRVIPILRRIKAGQFIREDGPQSHLQKAGTPTMGGIFIVPVGLLAGLIASGFHPWVIGVTLLTLSYGFIGWLDDWQILRRKSNKGISPKLKLLFQIGFAIVFCAYVAWQRGMTGSFTEISLSGDWVISAHLFFWPLAVFVLTAESNATNLTDGLDGLAAGTGSLVLAGLGVYILPEYPELTLFCLAMSGAYLGFLLHNRNPAKVFMGDTGSLALGGALASVAIYTNSFWVLFGMGGLFFVESVSVLLQVGYYKATKGADGVGKRLFKMAPYHHHLELSGWSEMQVVSTFYGVTLVLVLVCLGLPR
ncbi:MAG: phospho-N-acetylmuramoyl-pentapeptide-transferase [Prochlorotrichaceae cyanobacterium]